MAMNVCDADNGTMCLMTLDPCDKYPNMQLLERCGYIPNWALAADPCESMAHAIERQYPYYGGQLSGGSVTSEGVYTYPNDPDLYPFIKIENPETMETLYQYPHDIVVITHPDRPVWASRCD
jgi:hypothetical protein